jgi:hypothetical protein
MPHPSLYNLRRDPQPIEVSSVPVEDNKRAICPFPFGETDPDDNEICRPESELLITVLLLTRSPTRSPT